MSDYFTRAEAGEEMRVSEETIKRAINKGALRAKRTGDNGGGKYLIHRADLKKWFDEKLLDA